MKKLIYYFAATVIVLFMFSFVKRENTVNPLDEKSLGKAFVMLLQSNKPSYSGRSNEFVLQQKYIQFDIDASYDPFRTSLNLWFDGKIVRTQTGKGQGKQLSVTWDVGEYKGKKVYLQIVDADAKPNKTVKISNIIQGDKASNIVSGGVAEEIKKAKEFAAKAIRDNVKTAAADEHRPVFHFRPPSQRMNDPNAPFYANGYYHLFYQHNPLADFSGGGYMLWGHARSKDMVTWEQLPIALWPNWEDGELHCYSGDAYVVNGKPMLFYTGVPAPGEPRQQWAAEAVDKDFITWKNYLPKPVMKYFPEGGENPGLNWRDPFLFEDTGKTFCLLTTIQGVSLYEATNKKLDNWIFKNVIYKTKGAPECPNFFKFGNKWMLIVSPQNPVEYAIGAFDAQKGTFKVESKGVLNGNPQYYATQGMVDAQGNQILMGLVKGFKNGNGWRDCLALPRILSLGKDGKPLMHPLPALTSLRKNEKQVKELSLSSNSKVLGKINGDVLELEAEFEVGTATALGLRLRTNGDGQKGFEVKYENGQLVLPGTKIERIPLQPVSGKIKFQIFIDKGVIEVYTGNGSIAEVRVFYAGSGNNNIAVFADGGVAKLTQIKAYELKEANDLNWNGKI